MKPKPSASVLRVLAAAGLSLLLLAACRKQAPEELAGAASEPAASVRQLATHLQNNDLVGFARDALPPDVHARLDSAWRAGHSRWPLTELPLDDKLVQMLAALSAKEAEKTLQRSFDRQFARQDRDLKEAARTLGLFGVQYVKNEGDYTQEERDHYAQVIAALGDWAQRAPLGDPALARATLARLAPAARRSGLTNEQALNEAGMVASLQRLTPVFIEAKATFARYGLPLDTTFTDLRTGLVEEKGDTATVRIHYPLGEREIDTVVSLTRRDGRWYLTDYLRHADAVLAAVPAPDTLPPAPAADGEPPTPP
ncbi:hypothetical protein ASD77_06585 [Pseudoxanthomonas sp. Root65]|uniref:hypothetical protein n=1 Tax=Pseudoxanthomonas sp. Root65 TaxID=1736576 RepID=UPI0006F96257|nr:hypothetical protein [Pseudoxanthomonas sp. Root65]KRA54279.1 hypothetical protein ASD77_06585 [Pseudoxanthomonas sp. Root65]